MVLKLGMQHWVLEYYQIPSNDDPRMTSDLFTQRSTLFFYAFVWGYSQTIEVYDINVGTWRYTCTRGQSHSFPLSEVTQNEAGSQMSDTGPLVLWLSVCCYNYCSVV